MQGIREFFRDLPLDAHNTVPRSTDFTLSKAYKEFLEFNRANPVDENNERAFQVTMNNKKPKLLNIFAQKDNKKVTEDFETPKKPQKSEFNIKSSEHNFLEFIVPKPRNPFITG